MKTLFKTGYEKILKLFYEDRFAEFHTREVIRKTKLNENSAFKLLNEMEKDKILVSRKDGNMKKYSVAKNIIAYSMLMHLDISKLNALPSIRKNAINSFLTKLREKPLIVILFGSTAKENYQEQSDIDMLLIVNRQIDAKNAVSYADAQTGIRISPIQITVDNMSQEIKLKNDKVIQSAVNTGYPLTNHIFYYEMMYDERI